MQKKLGTYWVKVTHPLTRRGLSDVVTAVMLILVGMAIVGIVATAIFNLARAPSLSPEWNCLDIKTNQMLTLEKSCYDSEEDEITIMVKRSLDEKFEIDQLDFVLDADKGSSTWSCGGENCNCEIVGVGNSKLYYFDVSDLSGVNKVILKVGSCGADEMKVKNC